MTVTFQLCPPFGLVNTRTNEMLSSLQLAFICVMINNEMAP